MTSNTQAIHSVLATEVVLPGLVEPAGLQMRERRLAAPGANQACRCEVPSVRGKRRHAIGGIAYCAREDSASSVNQ